MSTFVEETQDPVAPTYADIMKENKEKFQETFDIMREKFPDETDNDIIRMCMFYDGNVSKISDAIEKKIQFRALNADIPREQIEEYGSSGVFFSTGKDKLGRPIAYLLMKRNNKKWDKDLVVKMMCYQMDKMIANMDEGVEQFLVMYSTAGVGMFDLDTTLFKKMMELFSTLYPERMGTLLLFPSGSFIKGIVNGVVKNILPARTAEKIVAVGDLSEIYEYIDEDVLLTEIGGKCEFDPTSNMDA